jgi:uncharacterized protein YuzE
MKTNFAISVEVDKDTGRVLAVYLQVREGKAASVEEFAGGRAFANYNRDGELLGVEILAPCEIKVLDRIAKTAPAGIRNRVKGFFRDSIPQHMVQDLIAAG